MDLRFLIRLQKLWTDRLLLTPQNCRFCDTQLGRGGGQQEPTLGAPFLAVPREAAGWLIPDGLSPLALPSPRSGTCSTKRRASEDAEAVIWPGTLGPSFQGLSQVRRQVTQISKHSPRGPQRRLPARPAVPRGRHAGAAVSASLW